MFVEDFKKIQKKEKNYSPIVDRWEWDKNKKKLVKNSFNWQTEIDKNKHVELKVMASKLKDFIPDANRKLSYGDATIKKDLNIHNVYNAVNIAASREYADAMAKNAKINKIIADANKKINDVNSKVDDGNKEVKIDSSKSDVK